MSSKTRRQRKLRTEDELGRNSVRLGRSSAARIASFGNLALARSDIARDVIPYTM